MGNSCGWRWGIMAVLLATHAAVLLDSAGRNFVTADEVAHIAAGISHWQTGTYSMYRVNPPLPRMLAVLPVLLERPDIEGIQPVDIPGQRQELQAGRQFAADNAEHYFRLVRLSRLAGVAWSLLGGWLIYQWASQLYGWTAGCLGAALWCFEPNILGHAQLVTPDIPATVSALATTYCFWLYLRNPSWERATIAGLLLGIALLTKFTNLVLYVVWPIMWTLYHCGAGGHNPPAIRLSIEIRRGALMVALSLLVVNSGYEFHHTGLPLGSIPFISRTFTGATIDTGAPGNRFQDCWLGRIPVPLPEDFLRGIDVQRRDFETGLRPSYLRGEIRQGGWWYYYVYALAVKVPLGTWAAVLGSLVLTLAGHRSSAPWFDEATLWAPVLVVLGLVSSQTGFNHHLRYVFPILPFVIVSASKLGFFLRRVRWKAGAMVLAPLLWAATSSLSIHPHYLSYFNEAAGGPANGHQHLLNSNIDWGQDLLYLKAWLDQHPEARPLGLAYANTVGPQLAGITEFDLPPRGPRGEPDPFPVEADGPGPLPGFYAVSVNFIQGAPYWACDRQGRWHYIDVHDYEYFQHFRPVGKAGYSIFLYHVTLDDANAVRHQLGLPQLSVAAPSGRAHLSQKQ
jgi:hypothetical protein